MIYRKIDLNGDYVFGSGNDFYEGTNAVSQAVYTSLKLLYGEWWEEQDQGLPLFEQILGTSGAAENIQAVDLIIQSRIDKVQGVIGIQDYTSNFDGKSRTYTASCTVQTQYGDATISIVF